jgi:hypothetical protein
MEEVFLLTQTLIGLDCKNGSVKKWKKREPKDRGWKNLGDAKNWPADIDFIFYASQVIPARPPRPLSPREEFLFFHLHRITILYF